MVRKAIHGSSLEMAADGKVLIYISDSRKIKEIIELQQLVSC